MTWKKKAVSILPAPARRAIWSIRQRVTGSPARLPAGTLPPEFVGVGVQKAGTSWWYTLVTDHPHVLLPISQVKELGYLDSLDVSDAEYAAHFPDRSSPTITGEWTPRYMAHFWAAGNLATVAPEAKLLILLRDPVDRYASAVQHGIERGRPVTHTSLNQAYQRGFYASQIQSLLRYFSRDQLLILTYEICVARPLEQIARTYRFLGIDDSYVPSNVETRVNETANPLVLDPRLEKTLTDLYRPEVDKLDVLDVDTARWRRFH